MSSRPGFAEDESRIPKCIDDDPDSIKKPVAERKPVSSGSKPKCTRIEIGRKEFHRHITSANLVSHTVAERRGRHTSPQGHVMKLSLILVLMLCVAWATSESNGRRRSQRRRPPAEVPKDLEDEEPELKSQPEEVSVEEPVKNEKTESKSTEATQPPVDDKEKKNTSSSPLSQLFAPRGTRRPRPAPRDSGRPRPTLPSFIKNPNRVARPTPTVVAASSRNTQKKAILTSSTARNGKVTTATNGNSARRRTTPAASVSTEEGNKRFGRNGRPKGSRSRSSSS